MTLQPLLPTHKPFQQTGQAEGAVVKLSVGKLVNTNERFLCSFNLKLLHEWAMYSLNAVFHQWNKVKHCTVESKSGSQRQNVTILTMWKMCVVYSSIPAAYTLLVKCSSDWNCIMGAAPRTNYRGLLKCCCFISIVIFIMYVDKIWFNFYKFNNIWLEL